MYFNLVLSSRSSCISSLSKACKYVMEKSRIETRILSSQHNGPWVSIHLNLISSCPRIFLALELRFLQRHLWVRFWKFVFSSVSVVWFLVSLCLFLLLFFLCVPIKYIFPKHNFYISLSSPKSLVAFVFPKSLSWASSKWKTRCSLAHTVINIVLFINYHVFLSLLCTIYIIPPAAAFHLKSTPKSQAQWHTSITLALERLRQEDYQFEMSLAIFWVPESLKYIKRSYLNPKETNYVFYMLISQCCHGLEFLGWFSRLDNFIVICYSMWFCYPSWQLFNLTEIPYR